MIQTQTDSAVELARQLAADFATRADEADRIGRLPAEDIQALKESGYLALSVPQEYGGYGLSMRECIEAHLELAKGSGSTAMVAAMQLHLFGNARETHPWPQPYFERFARAAVEGALFNSIASEPLMGSPSRGALFASRAVRDGDSFVINGHKNWSTGGKHLTYMLVGLMVDNDPALMLVPNDAPGIEWVETWSDSLSLRASDSDDVFFHDVRVPADHLVSASADKTKSPPNAWFPMMVAATYLGVALAARDATIRYALERIPTALGKPIATLPAIQRQIGEIDLMLQTARLVMLDAASAWTGDDANRRAMYPRIVAAKHLATETAITATDKALRVAGGVSITRALPLERYFRDVRGGLSHPPSGDTALEIIGRNAIDQLA
jgi:alkylation response protein AidB-like acyl-CoA dehydrogenase